MKYKVGDKVICLHDSFMKARLKIGKEYAIIGVTDNMLMLNYNNPNFNGDNNLWIASERFVLATEASRLLYGKD